MLRLTNGKVEIAAEEVQDERFLTDELRYQFCQWGGTIVERKVICCGYFSSPEQGGHLFRVYHGDWTERNRDGTESRYFTSYVASPVSDADPTRIFSAEAIGYITEEQHGEDFAEEYGESFEENTHGEQPWAKKANDYLTVFIAKRLNRQFGIKREQQLDKTKQRFNIAAEKYRKDKELCI